MYLEKIQVGPLRTNVILLACSETKKAVVIDPAEGSFKVILRHAYKREFSIESVLLTHSHWDHIGDVALFQEEAMASVYVHKLDAPNLASPGSDGIPSLHSIKGVEADGFLEDGQLFQVGKLYLQVIHTPGHTPGSLCFYLKEENLLISGDTLFKGTMGRFDPSESAVMLSSLKKLSHLPDTTRVIPGHGNETTIGAESWIDKPEI